MRMTPFHLPSSIAYCNCCNCWPVLSMYRYWISHVWTLLYNILTVWKEEDPDECKLASAAFFLVPLLKDDKRVDPFRRWVGLLHHNSLYEWRQTDSEEERSYSVSCAKVQQRVAKRIRTRWKAQSRNSLCRLIGNLLIHSHDTSIHLLVWEHIAVRRLLLRLQVMQQQQQKNKNLKMNASKET